MKSTPETSRTKKAQTRAQLNKTMIESLKNALEADPTNPFLQGHVEALDAATEKDIARRSAAACCASSVPREIAKCGCKNQEVKLHNPIILERTADGRYWTWSDCCCHALHPETALTKYSRTENAAIKFARRYFGFRHNESAMARDLAAPEPENTTEIDG